MATDELDLVDEIFGLTPGESAGQPASPESIMWESTSLADSSVSVAPKFQPRLLNPVARAGSKRRRAVWAAELVLAFAVGAIASLVLVTAVALIAFSAYSNRVVPGVRIGSVDVSGLDRDQVIARLQTAYAYLGQGEVTVTTPVGAATITYQQAGRAPDVEFMADAAMRIGHTGYPIDDAVFMLRSAIGGQSVPIVVRVDPMTVATLVRQLVGTTQVPPRDAGVTVQGGTFALGQSTSGSRINEKAISSAIIDHLTQPDAPADLQMSGPFVALDPQVSDQDAQDAAAAAQRMVVDVDLTWGGASQTPSPSQTPNPSQTPIPTEKTYTIDAQTIWRSIVFGTRTDGTYGPSVDPAPVQAYLSELSPKIATTPVEPTVVFDSSGKPVGVKGGKDGAGIDAAATSQAIVAYLDGLASGGQPGSVAIVTAPISPRITPESLSGMVIIGSWTTVFYPDVSNGNGVNIRLPAKIFNGQIVQPGQRFSFLKAVGPIDAAHGFTLGGVIEGGKSNHTGAIGGGICSVSTTMFNAAARAGLQIDERHAHFYYIYRYPVGLDATVFSNGSQVWDLKWTNDTPNPIVIRGYTTYGSKSTITFQLWSLPLDRKVAFSPEFKANVVGAVDRTVYVTTLKPGQQNRAEYPTIGFDTSRTRTVTDSAGNVIHQDTWYSHYTKVDGLLEIGRARAPARTPTPAPTPTPATLTPATPAPAPNPTPGPRRRKTR
jgi:vancomycin resistance protein YoaR